MRVPVPGRATSYMTHDAAQRLTARSVAEDRRDARPRRGPCSRERLPMRQLPERTTLETRTATRPTANPRAHGRIAASRPPAGWAAGGGRWGDRDTPGRAANRVRGDL